MLVNPFEFDEKDWRDRRRNSPLAFYLRLSWAETVDELDQYNEQ